jgi:hypothetical protein
MNTTQKIGTFGGALPTPSPMLATSLGLRASAFQFRDEMQAAYDANGKQTSVLNRAAVRSAMMEFWAKKRPNLTGSSLTQFVRARHPLLFDDGLQGVSGTNEQRQAANEFAPGIALGLGPVLKFVL